MEKTFQRQTAIPIAIRDVLESEYHKGDGSEPNYIETKTGKRVSRVNIIAVVVSIPTNLENAILVDDGGGKIVLRIFDQIDIFKPITVGDIVLIIGKPRIYNDEFYILPEIVKKIIDRVWIEVRKKELAKINDSSPPLPKRKKEEIVIDQKVNNQGMYDLIKSMDQGQGVEIEEIIQKSKASDAEKIITNLLLAGEIYEIKPGKVKILE